jgi:hypothetical protein
MANENRLKTCGDCIHADICKQINGGWFSRENIAYCKGFVDKSNFVEVVRKPVRGYEGRYVVDQFGRVFGVDRTTTVQDNERIYEKPIAGKQMKQSVHTAGYKTVTLTKDGKTKTVYVHRIVAEAFVENPENLPMVNHKDEDKTNNFAENLEWCSASYNRTYGKAVEKHAKTLRGKKHTEEHKRKISESMKNHHAEKDDFCSYGERRTEDDQNRTE